MALSLSSSTGAFTALQRAVPVPLSFQNPRFQVWGSNPSQGIFCDVTPMTTHINQSKKLSENILHWFTVAESWEKEQPKKWPWLGFEPQTWKREIWSGTGAATVCWIAAHAVVEEDRESALWLPIASHSVPMGVHQAACSFRVKNNHVQRCIKQKWFQT